MSTRRKYLIVPSSVADAAVMVAVHSGVSTATDVVRRSVDGARAIVRYAGVKPAALSEYPTWYEGALRLHLEINAAEWEEPETR